MYSNSNNYQRKKCISCTNCGQSGHVLRNCKQPITSFGIIVYKHTDDFDEDDLNPSLKKLTECSMEIPSNIKILMIQRKDTMGYTDFLRGKYKANCVELLFREMTIEEQHNLLNKSFDELWKSLWINHSSRSFRNEYYNAKNKFNQLDIPYLISKYTSNYVSTELSFPKGRKSFQTETPKACAEREFYEETGYTNEDYEPIDPNSFIIEEFTGTDNIKYKHIYYITKVKKGRMLKPKVSSLIQMEEVKDIGWFSIPEAIHLMRPYDIAKKHVICTFMDKLE